MDAFYNLSAKALEEVADFFESSWPGADVDLLEDVLTVTLSEGKQYVINRHGVTQQIWVASPFTGAHHFSFREGVWFCTRTQVPFLDLIKKERDSYAS